MNIFISICFMALAFAGEGPSDALKKEFPHWTQVGPEVQGDLNGDKKKDFAAILQKRSETDQNGEALVVVFFNKNGKFELQTKSPKATCVGCGGPKAPMSEPLGQLEITSKGILTIEYQGGSREAWTDVMKWRWDNALKDFTLIGQTSSNYDTLVEDPEVNTTDVNFLTLKGNKTSGKKISHCKIEAKYKNQKLTDYDFEEGHDLSEVCK